MTRSLTLSLLAGCIALGAADQSSVDLRVGLGIVPGSDKYEATDVKRNGVSFTWGADTTLSSDGGASFQIQAIANAPLNGQLGLAYGAGVFYRTHSGTQAGGSGHELMNPGQTFTSDYSAFGIELTAGPSLALTPQLGLELRPFFDVGLGNQDNNILQSWGSGTHTMEGSTYLAYGVTAGAYYTVNQFQAGLELGYMAFTGDSNETLKDSVDKLEWTSTVSGSGVTASLVLGLRL